MTKIQERADRRARFDRMLTLGISGGADETTTSTANDIYLASAVDTAVIEEIRPYMVMANEFYRFRTKQNSNLMDYPLVDDPGAASSKTEATTLSNFAGGITTSKATATAGTVGIMTTVTDEIVEISLVAAMPLFAGVLGRSVAEKIDADGTALVDDFTNTTSTSGVDYSWSTRQAAISALEQRDAVGQLVEVVHPVQTGDLRADLTTSTAAVWGNSDVAVGGLLAASMNGFAFSAFGVPTFHTSSVATANGGADRAGGIFVAGVTLGKYEIWGPRTELERDASNVATEIVTTARYGVIEIRDTWGQTVITDA